MMPVVWVGTETNIVNLMKKITIKITSSYSRKEYQIYEIKM
jgi:hypothetical protein